MSSKTNYSKKTIYFKLTVGNKHTKIILPVSTVYNGEDEIDADKLKTYFSNVFTSCSKQLNHSNSISNDILNEITEDYNNKCSKSFYIQDHEDGPYKEYTISTGSFTYYTNQMIDLGTDIKEHKDRHIKQEPKDIKPYTTSDKGYYEHSEDIIENKLNKKDLLKIESIKLKDEEQFFSWYRDLTLHCVANRNETPLISTYQQAIENR
eukprot:15346084-Ditylum_brightwellii.AAC.1